MDLHEERGLWNNAIGNRKFQHLCGSLSAFFFALALFSLLDGLQAKMRAGPEELDILPGEELLISGPCPVKNPVNNDLQIRWSPKDPPIAFNLEGFYTGYWFGSGMWRGKLLAQNDADTGTYNLYISFRGAPAQTLQSYTIKLYKNKGARQSASRSIIYFLLALNPFLLAPTLAICALFAGILTYIFGMRYKALLQNLDLVEIYRIDESVNLLWCLVAKKNAPPPGSICNLVTANGSIFGSAKVEGWQKGKLSLIYKGDVRPSTNDLVCLRAN